MKGLFGCNTLVNNWKFHDEKFSLNIDSNDKFHEDKIFTQNDNYILALDGVILNKSKILKKNVNWSDFFMSKIEDLDNFLPTLKGSFHGVIFDKKLNEITLFNDSIGNKNFFYYTDNTFFSFHFSDIELIKFIKKQNKKIELREDSIYTFLAYGFLFSQQSWIKGSNRLKPGSILRFKDNKISISRYRELKSHPRNGNVNNQITEEFQYLFENAVNLQYMKDREYGYSHYATLSGGLDSRSTILQAYDLGYKNQTTFTCSQSGYEDETIAKQIASDFNFTHQFYALNEFKHLLNIPKTISKIGGASLYSGPAHVIMGIEKYWNNSYGLIHTGHIGDGVMGAFLNKIESQKPNKSFGRVSSNFLPFIDEIDQSLLSSYENEEEFKLNERAFCGAAAGVWGLEHVSYNISPFADTDILEFLLSLPYSNKYKRKIYVEWLLKFHPKWTMYRLESLHSKPNAYWKFKHQKAYLRFRFGWKKLLSRNYRLLENMAPEQYWLEQNKSLQDYYSNEFHEALGIAKDLKLPFIENINKFYKSNIFKYRAQSLHLAYIINLIYKD